MTPPIHALAVELLLDIFQYAAHADALNLVRTGQVCAHWRLVLASAPRLYTLVVLDDAAHSPAAAASLAAHFLARADGLPFDVHCTLRSADAALGLLGPFLRALPRWRVCTLAGAREEEVRFEDVWSRDAGDPECDVLKLSLFDAAAGVQAAAPPPPAAEADDNDDEESDDEEEEEAPPPPPPPTFRQATTPLSSNLLCMELTTAALPRPLLSAPLLFASLEIKEVSPTLCRDPAALLHMLVACPALEFLSYTGTMAVPLVPRGAPPPSVAHLPRLRSLVLHGTLCARIVLSFLDAPALRELYLEFLNVEWAFDVRNPYRARPPGVRMASPAPSSSSSGGSAPRPPSSTTTVSPCATPPPAGLDPLPLALPLAPPPPDDAFAPGPSSPPASPAPSASSLLPATSNAHVLSDEDGDGGYESGDSADSDGDYSQSPFSDHATGMGVRALLRRARPPLRVLEMDYADMRTKDFRWLFREATELEEFRIVASDMADRVVRMLAPPPRPSYSAKGKRREHVALPRMRALELRQCQRLSGDAILHAVRAREARAGERAAAARERSEWDDTPDASSSSSSSASDYESDSEDESDEEEEGAAGEDWARAHTLEEIARGVSRFGPRSGAPAQQKRRRRRRREAAPVRLEDVAIIGCQGFGAEHGAALGAVLGERLRLGQ